MKHLKSYESTHNISDSELPIHATNPQVGDYVIVLDYDPKNVEINNYINTHLGKVVNVVIEGRRELYPSAYKIIYKVPKRIYADAYIDIANYVTAQNKNKSAYYILIYVKKDEIEFYSYNRKECVEKLKFLNQTKIYNL